MLACITADKVTRMMLWDENGNACKNEFATNYNISLKNKYICIYAIMCQNVQENNCIRNYRSSIAYNVTFQT